MTLPNTNISERPSSTSATSTHVRALITWIAIFPLVTLSAYALAPFASEWNPSPAWTAQQSAQFQAGVTTAGIILTALAAALVVFGIVRSLPGRAAVEQL